SFLSTNFPTRERTASPALRPSFMSAPASGEKLTMRRPWRVNSCCGASFFPRWGLAGAMATNDATAAATSARGGRAHTIIRRVGSEAKALVGGSLIMRSHDDTRYAIRLLWRLDPSHVFRGKGATYGSPARINSAAG